MKEFIRYFFGVMDKRDRRGFKKYIVVLFLGSVFAILGVGSVIPFINALIQPELVTSWSFFQGWPYSQIVLILTILLIIAFGVKNIVAVFLIKHQYRFLLALAAKTREKLFKQYMTLHYEYHLNRNTPDLIRNINNETMIFSNNVVSPLGVFLTDLFSSVFVLIVLLSLNPIFTLLVTGCIVSGVIVFLKLIKGRMRFYADLRATAWSAITHNVLSGLYGIKEAKLYHCEEHFLQAFADESRQLKNSSVFQQVYTQTPRMLIEFIGVMVVMSVLCGFIFFGSNPKNLLVLLGVFGVAAAQLLPSLNRMTQSIVKIKYGMPALITIYNELNQTNDQVTDELSTQKTLQTLSLSSKIQAKNIHYSYRDGTKALNGIDLDIPKNKKIAFVGDSGAGKTTLIDLLMGLYRPSQGQILLDDKLLDSENAILSFQKLFAYVPQHIILYDQSIKHNIAFGLSDEAIDEERLWRCLQQAHMKSFVEGLKDKEKTFIGEGGVRLSGGQRQRIGIARALYRQPQILVMDEATSALDNQTEREITNVLSELTDLTIITIAHRLSTIKHYDLIYLMKAGKVVASGTYNALLSDSALFRDMVNAVNQPGQ